MIFKAYGGGGIKPQVFIGRDKNLVDMYDSYSNVELINVLKAAKGDVDVVTVGSLRDIAALYNNSPDLFERKVKRIFVFAGDAEGTMIEHNVALDVNAFLRIMNSKKFDIYWIPCFQCGIWTTGCNTSYFTVKHAEILQEADDSLQMWFLHRYEKSSADFQEYILQNHDTTKFLADTRNLWCAPLFPFIDGSMEEYLYNYNNEFGCDINMPCGFSKRRVFFWKDGKVEYGKGNIINVFEIYDHDRYVELMKYVLKSMYSNYEG